jgi:anthranilate/para-aminobenzoate synthase component I
MDMAITIRTIVYNNKNVYVQTGAGIVADSIRRRSTKKLLTKQKRCF